MEKKYLEPEDIEVISTSEFEEERAEALIKYLKNHIIIKEDNAYKLDEESMTYQIYKGKATMSGIITPFLTRYLYESFKNLKKDEQMKIKTQIGEKRMRTVFSSSFIKSMSDGLITKLTRDIEFKHDPDHIHFNNGFIDLTTGELNPREIGKHYITRTTGYNYEESTEEDRKYIYDVLQQIFREDDVFKYMLYYYGSCLSGQSIRECKILVNVGRGSYGKSTVLKLLELCLSETYYCEFMSDAFSKGSNKDKVMNQLDNKPVRVVSLNECTGGKLDTSLLKRIADGEATTRKLYQDGVFNFKLQTSLIISANQLLNFTEDSGINRRLLSYEYQNEFTEDDARVDNQTVFKKDKDLLGRLDNQRMKNAIFNTFLPYCMKWYNKESVPLPEVMENAKDTLVSAGDIFQDFIDKNLVLTKDTNDRIHKAELLKLFYMDYPEKKNSIKQLNLINALKDKRIEYNYGLRKDGAKGCFIGVRYKEEGDDDEHTAKEQQDNEEQEQREEKQRKEILRLQEKAKEQDRMIEEMRAEINKMKKGKDEEQTKYFLRMLAEDVKKTKARTERNDEEYKKAIHKVQEEKEDQSRDTEEYSIVDVEEEEKEEYERMRRCKEEEQGNIDGLVSMLDGLEISWD